MRGQDTKQSSMLCLMSPETAVPSDHPGRKIKRLADDVLRELSPVFDGMYATTGRPSIPPERLLKATLLMALYSVRSERQICEQLDDNLLFRWFLDMDMLEPRFDHSTFTRNRERLMTHQVAAQFFDAVVTRARRAKLMSSDHFTVDGTLIEAWASLKSFKKKDDEKGGPPDDPGNPSVDFHGERRSNETHASTSDPEARLLKKGRGKEAKLSFCAHALMENRNGLLCDVRISEANGFAERETALAMLAERRGGPARATVGADKGYDTRDFVARCRAMGITPHVAQHVARSGGSALDARTTRQTGYAVSQRVRKRVEEVFGWFKTVGGLRKTKLRGIAKNQHAAFLVGAAYNLLRIAKLLDSTQRPLPAGA